MTNIIAIDPGKDKTGIAVFNQAKTLLEKKVALTSQLDQEISFFSKKYNATLLIMGSGTNSKKLASKITVSNPKMDIVYINEKGSTLEARTLYWREHEPKWFLRIFPRSFLLPPEQYDDYAAVVIGLRYLGK